jgi:hypothetical protein
MDKKLELRMYGLVPYNISPIQQAIQFGHAIVEYGQKINSYRVSYDGRVMLKLKSQQDEKYNQITKYDDWADNWKTFIILNGGTSNHTQNRYTGEQSSMSNFIGSMEQSLMTLVDNDVMLSTFYEPDLNDMLSAIVFIVDERVFNKKDYPDFEDWVILNYGDLLRPDPSNYKTFGKRSYELARMIKDSEVASDKKVYQEWVDLVGGDENVFLRDFLKNFRLA